MDSLNNSIVPGSGAPKGATPSSRSSKQPYRRTSGSFISSRAVVGGLALLSPAGAINATGNSTNFSFVPTHAPSIPPSSRPSLVPTPKPIGGNSNGKYPNCGNGWDIIKAYLEKPDTDSIKYASLKELLSGPGSDTSLYSKLETCEVNPYPYLMDALKTVATIKTANGTGNLYYSFQCSNFSLPLAPPKIVSECDAENGHVKGNLEYVNNVTSRVVVACGCPFFNSTFPSPAPSPAPKPIPRDEEETNWNQIFGIASDTVIVLMIVFHLRQFIDLNVPGRY